MIAPQTMEIAQQQWEIPLPFTEIKYPLDNRVTIITFSTSLLYLILIFFAYMVKTWKFELKKETDVSTEAIKSIQSFVSSKDKSFVITSYSIHYTKLYEGLSEPWVLSVFSRHHHLSEKRCGPRGGAGPAHGPTAGGNGLSLSVSRNNFV